MNKKLLSVVGLITALFVSRPALSQDQPSSFYAGKTISIIVGFGPGGGYDLYARLLSRFLGDHIPGKPTVIVQNMDGAGGVRAANYVYATAPKDGTFIAGVNQGAAMFQLLGGKGAQYDPRKFAWLGRIAFSNNVLYVSKRSGVTSLDDAKTREVSMAGSGIISDADIYPAVLNGLLGTKFKVVNGYAGTNESDLAVERGEVDGRGGGAYSSLVSTHPQWLTNGDVRILVQIGFDKEPDLPNVPLLLDLVKGDEDRDIASLVTLPVAIGYNYWLAPEVPADRLQILRRAFAETMKDPGLIAEAKKQSFEVRPKTGEELESMVNQAAALPKPVLTRAASVLGW
ncbi:MAG TPA: tripartite tricarboxylate transporter substrate-binding protein [Beijerinckiaceae bacterium]|nr:tripartite tricarboxylate transporter substrate-binding protein [Beijerinckiaceae bacterium]